MMRIVFLMEGIKWAAAGVGNAVILLFLLNRAFARPWSKDLLNALRTLTGVLILVYPVLLWFYMFAGGVDWAIPVTPDAEPSLLRSAARWLLIAVFSVYGPVCVVMAYVAAVKIATEQLRPLPEPLAKATSAPLDIARELGHTPAGTGKHRRLAVLPGNGVFTVDFTEKTYYLPELPAAWDGLTVLHLSDLHFIGTPDRVWYERVFDLCAGWEPDIVALTGDIVDGHKFRRWVMPLLRRLRWKHAAFAVLGNHDLWYEPDRVRRRLRRVGFEVVGNGWVSRELLGHPLIVLGHEGPWFPPGPDHLKGCPMDGFRLCLSHTPDNIDWARWNDVSLMLSGHNHGGQIRVPVIGSIFVPSAYGRRYDCGTFHVKPTLLHVSRGLGGKQPLRYNCRPEVTRLTLKHGPRPETETGGVSVSGPV